VTSRPRLGGSTLDPLDDEPRRCDDERLRFDKLVLTPHTAVQPRFNALDDLAEVMEGPTRGLIT
jgi:hypothetical protein